MASKWGASHERMIRHALRVKPNTGTPAFTARIVSNYNGYAYLLQWGDVPLLDPEIFPRFKVYGHYAAYPLELHDGGALVEPEPEVTVSRKSLETVLEAFGTHLITDETMEAIEKLSKVLKS
jgi:hypothetical protein